MPGDDDGLPGLGPENGREGEPQAPRLPALAGVKGGARPGAGRPLGAFNRSNRELREYLIKLTGRDAIVEHWKVAAVPIMSDRTKLLKLARYFDCSLKEA